MVTLVQKRYQVIQGLHLLKDDPKLRVLVLDISNVCNFECLYCYAANEQQNICGNLLELEDYKKIIRHAKNFGVKTIWFLGGRENTLSSIYLELVKFCCGLDLFVLTFTNGAIFGDDDLARKIFNLSSIEICQQLSGLERFSLILKCDSFVEYNQNQLSGNKQAFQQVKQALINLKETGVFQSQPFGFKRFGVNSVLTKINFQDISGVFEFVLKNGLVYFCDLVLFAGLGLENKDILEVSGLELQSCLRGLEKVIKDFNLKIEARDLINQYDQPCVLFDNFLFLLRNGQVLPCAGYYEHLGTLGSIDLGFSELWKRKQALIENYYYSGCSNQKCPCMLYLNK